MTPEERIARLEALVAQQREQITALREEVQARRARLAQDSPNSHRPPTSDRRRRRPRSQRRASGRETGGQLGQRGETLALVASPDQGVGQAPARCAHGPASLQGVAPQAEGRRPVLEPPPVRLQVGAHRAAHVRCPGCGRLTQAALPADGPVASSTGRACARWWSTWSSSSWCPLPACATCSPT